RGIGSKVGEAEVNAKPVCRFNRRLFFVVHGGIEEESIISLHKISLAQISGQHAGEVVTNHEGNLDASRRGTNAGRLHADQAVKPVVKRHGTIWAEDGTGGLVPSERFDRFRYSPNGVLCTEAEAFTKLLITKPVDAHLGKDVVIEANASCIRRGRIHA